MYECTVTTQTGKILFKADPLAFKAEYRSNTTSITTDLSGFKRKDSVWVTKRHETDPAYMSMSTYEVHLGSWKEKDREERDGFCIYIEAAHELADYVKEMGYTRVELMGIAKRPCDGSWSYRVTGYPAPTSRYGTPEGFMYFMDHMHKRGIDVILDRAPAHSPKDAHGLADSDGQVLYEYADSRMGEYPD